MTSYSIDRPIGMTDVFQRTEITFIGLITMIFFANIALSLMWDQSIAWHTFGIGIFAAIGLVICGCYMRIVKGADRGGKVVVTVGLKFLFGAMMGIFFHMHLPRPEPILTDALLAMDRWFGYDWPSAVAWVAETPGLGSVLNVIYLSSAFQIVAVMAILALLGRNRDLDAMVFCNAFGLFIVFVVWQTFPNLSQSTYLPIPVETAIETNLITHSVYGKHLLDMAQNGMAVVEMDKLLGQVAFPSYHMVMSALVVWFAQRTILFWPIFVLNTIMVPAILIHGAHHVADVIGGIVVLAVAVKLAYVVVNRLYRDEMVHAT